MLQYLLVESFYCWLWSVYEICDNKKNIKSFILLRVNGQGMFFYWKYRTENKFATTITRQSNCRLTDCLCGSG